MKNKIKTIGIFTSGGDSPGMNAAIRAVVRTAMYNGLKVFGIYRGYQGLIEGEIIEMKTEDVANIIQKGGTILKSARSKAFLTSKGREKAYQNIKKWEIDALVAIGGDGTFTGAKIFEETYNIPIIGVPGTIDNDLYGTDYTIGYDTAINNVVEAVDKIRDTATSHNRLFFVEVMGRDVGFIALRSGISVGAAAILVPETKTYINRLTQRLEEEWKRRKGSLIIIVAEGDDEGGAFKVAEKVKAKFDKYDTRVSVLGHLQRGGNPTAADRVLASRVGNAAVNALIAGKSGVMAGVIHRDVAFTPFQKAIKHHKELNEELLHLAEILSL